MIVSVSVSVKGVDSIWIYFMICPSVCVCMREEEMTTAKIKLLIGHYFYILGHHQEIFYIAL